MSLSRSSCTAAACEKAGGRKVLDGRAILLEAGAACGRIGRHEANFDTEIVGEFRNVLRRRRSGRETDVQSVGGKEAAGTREAPGRMRLLQRRSGGDHRGVHAEFGTASVLSELDWSGPRISGVGVVRGGWQAKPVRAPLRN